MVTLYLEVELSRDKRPGTEQNKSVGLTTQVPPTKEKKCWSRGSLVFHGLTNSVMKNNSAVYLWDDFVVVFVLEYFGAGIFVLVFKYCIIL